jgi:hypothetical protein
VSITDKELLSWAAGVIEGCGTIASTVREGPSRMYAEIVLLVPVGHSDQIKRLTIAANNGGVAHSPVGFELVGYSAIRGFMADLWPYFSPVTRTQVNMELKRHKLLAAEQRSKGLTR